MLQSQDRANLVRQKEQFWISQGVRGVPAMVFDQRHLVTGAQGEQNYARILLDLQDDRAAKTREYQALPAQKPTIGRVLPGMPPLRNHSGGRMT